MFFQGLVKEGLYPEGFVELLSSAVPCKRAGVSASAKTKAETFLPRAYRTDKSGFTSMYQAMVLKDPETAFERGQALLRLPPCPQDTLWITREDVLEKTATWDGSKAAVDAWVSEWTGVDVASLNDKTQLCKYMTHARSWRTSLMGVEAEGWFENKFLPNRIRTLLLFLCDLKKSQSSTPLSVYAASVQEKILQETVCALQCFRMANKLQAMSECESPKISTMAAVVERYNIVAALKTMPEGESLTLPVGCQAHAMYISFIKTLNDLGEPSVVMRIHNLGDGSAHHVSDAKTGKIFAKNTVVPMPCVEGTTAPSFDTFLESILHFAAQDSLVAEAFYAVVEHFEHKLQIAYPSEASLRASACRGLDYAHKPQKVGNCVFKNHSASMASRLGKDLFKEFKAYEIRSVEARLRPLGLSDKMITGHERVGLKRKR
jgi:hypothetical protein